MNVLLLPIASLLLINSATCQEWDRHLTLDPDGKYQVWWTATDEDVTFQIEVETRGWVGFGISPYGGMTGSDVVIGWIANNRAGFHDRYAVSRSLPVIDDHQDWEFLWCCENDTHTAIRFKRQLLTCDEQDVPINDQTTRLIYAYNDEDPSSSTAMNYHAGTRGTKSVLLYEPRRRRSAPKDPKDVQFWNVTSANVSIPHHKDTAYICTVFAFPRLNGKHHVIKVEPIIQKGNERFVHHVILYKCSKVVRPFRLRGYTECFTDDPPDSDFPSCQHAWAGWAVGGGAFEFPDHAGMPIEEGYYRLQVHYDNPGLKEGIYDNSGLRIAYTPILRQYDSEYLAIGSMWHPCVFVPPKQRNFIASGHAPPSCLNKGILPEGIKVFAVALHSHVIGRRVTVRHFRNDEELQPLAKDKNYDFNYQQTRLLPEERTILPDDHLVVECTYDSSERNQTTFGGLGTRQEMCLAFLAYYPKSSMQSSVSCPSPRGILNAIGVNETSSGDKFVVSPLTGRNETYIDFLKNYPWDSESLRNVQYAVRFGSYINICTVGGNVTVMPTRSTYPRVKRFYEEPDLCANRSTPGSSIPEPSTTTERPPPPPSTAPPTQQPQRRRKVPQTIPYEILDRIILQLG